MRFESKRDAWLWIVPLAVPGIIAIAGPPVAAIVAVAVTAVIAFWAFRSTYYVIDGDTLTIRSMGLRWRVPIGDIRSVTPTRSVASSPALSLDRLRIDYGSKAILVSPEDRNRFIAALRSVNPAISV